jgi:hypothetical protein
MNFGQFRTIWVVYMFIVLFINSAGRTSATARHRRDGGGDVTAKKKKKEDTCVYGYCLDPTYNSLELPSKITATHIRMNLEVHLLHFNKKIINRI